MAGLLAGRPVSAAEGERPVTLPRSLQWELPAPGDPARPYRIMAAWPEEAPPPGGFPVLYLLDGNAIFATAVEAARVQGRRAAATGVAPALLVGIGYPTESPFDMARRSRDYTPPAATAPEGTGGADAFLDFLLQVVRPAVAARFPVNPDRTALFGHSFGGLFALHALFARPGSFRRTIAASPSIWFAGGAVLESERRFAAAPPPEAAQLGLLITVGGLEEQDAGASPARQAVLRERRMAGQARELAARLAALGPRGPQVSFVEFPGENHGSVLPVAVNRALRFALGPEP
ncbi:alpha/beta hydrolase [Siccirubricoccus phaeus]|uniref:alpha/beta hydrolase n=1 Tax=Siccirubricoccus phaeus TaxID=2595053 RepID=UPI0011F1A4A2|nr:alpha/beta hydrolase-fold protein [Siccirubricoccus phaeus]